MLGDLNKYEIENLLASQNVGRIACVKGKQPYIVPVTYAYDGHYIYGQTCEGKKLDILRANPNVCFETDVMTDMANWKSVVINGTFEELKEEEATKARKVLSSRIFTLMTGMSVHLHEHATISEVDESSRIKPVLYRIKIKQKTGRFQDQQCFQ